MVDGGTGGSGGSAGGGAGGGAPDTHDGGLCTDTWEGYGQTFFATNCTGCHVHDHSNFVTQSVVQAENDLITTRVASGVMPQGATLPEEEKQRLLLFMACGAPSQPVDAGSTFEAVTARAAVAKVKNILVGLPPTDAEVAAVTNDSKALNGLITEWMKLPQYTEKMKVFFELAFQQTQITSANFVDLITNQGLGTGAAIPMLVQNIRESFARTVLALDAEGRPFTDAFTTHRLMMTPALMELYAFLDARHMDNAGKVIDDWAKANPKLTLTLQNKAGAVAIEDSVNPDSPNYLHFYDADVGKLPYAPQDSACQTDPIVMPANSYAIHFILYGAVAGHPNPAGGNCPQRAGTLAGVQLTQADFTTWKMVTMRPPSGGEATTVFFNVPALRTSTELVLRTPRPGFFSTPGFQANWPTNQSNQMRVTVNQALIVATGMQVDGLDATPSPTTPGLDEAHAAETACFSCHRLLDPTRAILSSSYSWFYNQATDANLMKEKGIFQFQGVTKNVNSIDDFGSTLANHPAMPAAWAQKLCNYVNSAPCATNDPEFKRVVAAFASSNYDWATLVRELLASPMVTNLSQTATNAAQGEVIAVSRRDHLCAALNARLKLDDVCGQTLKLGVKTGAGQVPQIVSGMPSDGYGRGATEPVLPNNPTLFYRAGLENICASVATLLIDAAVKPDQPNATHWVSTAPDAAIDDFTSLIIGLTPSDPRSAQVKTLLKSHFTEAQKTGTKTDALRSTFVTACLSPTFIGVGL